MESSKIVTFESCANAAATIGVEPCILYAIYVVESGGKTGFLDDGRAKILFEGQWFWKNLVNHGVDPETIYLKENRDILIAPRDSTSATRKAQYKGGIKEYDRLNKAVSIHKVAALESASWSSFQIMGFNYKMCGYNNVFEFVLAMETSAESQLIAVLGYCKGAGMIPGMLRKDFVDMALRYNGSAYRDYKYDEQLQTAYNKCLKQHS
jgi:hypothetical protein